MDFSDGNRAPLITISAIVPSSESLRSVAHDTENNIDTENPNKENCFIEKEQKDEIHGNASHMFQGKESILSTQINDCVDETNPKIPDGGWGWLVVFASFFINLAADGVSNTFGFLYVEFLNTFKASKSATSWIGSLFMAVPLLAGPIGSALVDKYGCKYMTILGAVISTTGFILSSYAKSIAVMYITFGFIGGLGLGLCYVTAVVSIAFWFEKKRTVALGLAASGSGFGTVVFAPMTTILLREYGWRGTILIISGFYANICVCGFLMKDPDWIVEEEKNSEKRREKAKKRLKSKKQNGEYVLKHVSTSLDLVEKDKCKSMINLPTYLKENEEVPLEVLRKLNSNKRLYKVTLENSPNLLKINSTSNENLDKTAEEASLSVPLKFSMNVQKMKNFKIPESPEKQEQKWKHPFHIHNYLKNIKFRKRVYSKSDRKLLMQKLQKLKASSCPSILKKTLSDIQFEREEKWYEEFLNILKDLSHVSLFLELHFFLMNLSTIILFIWFIVPYFYLADHMTKYGYTEDDASFVISVIGITNTIGMVILGWLGERIDVTKTYAICLLLCGITCGFIPIFTSSYGSLVTSSGLFGLFFASSFALSPAILAKLVPLEKFTMAYGLSLLCQGIGNLIGPPLAGMLYDMTESWDQSFYQAGFWMVVSGILMGIIPFTENKRLFGTKKCTEKIGQLENLV